MNLKEYEQEEKRVDKIKKGAENLALNLGAIIFSLVALSAFFIRYYFNDYLTLNFSNDEIMILWLLYISIPVIIVSLIGYTISMKKIGKKLKNRR